MTKFPKSRCEMRLAGCYFLDGWWATSDDVLRPQFRNTGNRPQPSTGCKESRELHSNSANWQRQCEPKSDLGAGEISNDIRFGEVLLVRPVPCRSESRGDV